MAKQVIGEIVLAEEKAIQIANRAKDTIRKIEVKNNAELDEINAQFSKRMTDLANTINAEITKQDPPQKLEISKKQKQQAIDFIIDTIAKAGSV